ncbi:hypothetical protein Peur_014346 [Populus x canadensis]
MVATILKSSYLAFIYSAFVGINEDVIKRYSEDEVCLCLDLASEPRQGTVPSLNLDRWLQDPLGMVLFLDFGSSRTPQRGEGGFSVVTNWIGLLGELKIP